MSRREMQRVLIAASLESFVPAEAAGTLSLMVDLGGVDWDIASASEPPCLIGVRGQMTDLAMGWIRDHG